MSKRKNLDKEEREEVIRFLLAGSNNGVLRRGAYKITAEEFGCEWQSIKRLWKKYDGQKQAGVAHPQLESGRKGNAARRSDFEELRERLRDVPLSDRTTAPLGFGARNSLVHAARQPREVRVKGTLERAQAVSHRRREARKGGVGVAVG